MQVSMGKHFFLKKNLPHRMVIMWKYQLPILKEGAEYSALEVMLLSSFLETSSVSKLVF